MAFIRFLEQTEPDTPPAGRAHLYVDAADKQITIKKDDGSVHKFLTSPVIDVNGFIGSVDIFDILDNQSVASDVLFATSSLVYVSTLILPTTPLLAGDYRIDWSLIWNYDDAGKNISNRVIVNGNTIWEMSEEPPDSGADVRTPASDFDILTLPAGINTIEIQTKVQNAGNVASIYRSRIALQRVR